MRFIFRIYSVIFILGLQYTDEFSTFISTSIYHFQYQVYMTRIFTLLFLISFACTQSDQNGHIHTYSFDEETSKLISLPKQLNELSDLVMTSDGRLFGHNDEKANIYQIDYETGKILKSFSLGKKTIKKDFEGIAIKDNIFYLVTSSGEIYEFEEGKDRAVVSYEKYKTRLSATNDVEGLCYDPVTNSLLLACKGDPGKGNSGYRAVYTFSLSKKKLKKKPRFLISIKSIYEKRGTGFVDKLGDFFLLTDKSFAPSGIERHPETGNFFILSSQGNVLIEISPEGEILGRKFLDRKRHFQPEGITFTPDNCLLIGDEGGNRKARITKYYPVRNE